MPRARVPIRTVLALTAALAVAVGGRAWVGARTDRPTPPGTAIVAKVVDGDTIAVRSGRSRVTVRLLGVDTPESVKPRTPVECFAKEAAAHTRRLLPPGTRVELERDVEARDRYGRLLAYVRRSGDGLFVNLVLVRDGYAAPLTIPPNVAHTAELTAAAAEARRAGRGLWGRCGGPHEAPP